MTQEGDKYGIALNILMLIYIFNKHFNRFILWVGGLILR